MDEKGEVPAPFCLEKYNFNPHNIRGEFDLDQDDRPKIIKKKNGDMVDKKGKRVNRQGYLEDKYGNIIDKNGRKKFDRSILNSDGDMPKLYNYNGKKFDIEDIIGYFDKDKHGNALLRMNNQGEFIDNKGRRVNEKGYLIDMYGDIVDKDGKRIF